MDEKEVRFLYGNSMDRMITIPYDENKEYIALTNPNIPSLYQKEAIVPKQKDQNIDPNKPMIAFTFDDGPSDLTLKLMDAFDKYEEIYEAITKITQSYEIDLILLAIGPPTATCLAFDLYNAEKRALDLGNLDIEYEWMNLGVENKVAVSGKYTHEVKNGNKNIEEIDQKYENQIVY